MADKVWAIIIIAAALAGCGEAVELDRLSAGRRVVAAEAMSGDTLKLADGKTLRLAGIEAPHGEEPYAGEARAELQSLASGQALDLAYGGARTTPTGDEVAQARLAIGRRWIEGELLRAGAVRVRTFGDNRSLALRMLDAEAAARRAKRGLWALPAYQVRLPQEIGPGDAGFTVLEGRVVRAGQTGAIAYLDFAQDWRRGVSVHVPRAALDDFHLAGRHPLDLQGRLIRVRGFVADGRSIRIDHPESLEVLREP